MHGLRGSVVLPLRIAACIFATLLCAALSARAAATPTNHWAFEPLDRPALPAVKGISWPRTSIDFFILAKLEEKGLAPAPPADKATLLRRVTLDLHGLPPTPAELETFLADSSTNAFSKVVDRLLDSPRYGERWARHWLDLARFSESDGFEYDKMRDQAWPYRDYVIRSLNDDKPYARFIAEQIAGDNLEPITRDGIAATGFLVAGPYDEAGNNSVSASLKARIREEEMEDVIAAVSQTFLAVTVNCARCHDHKFDPIPQSDYYRLKASLDGVRHGNRPFATPAETRAQQDRIAELKGLTAEIETQLAALDSQVRTRILQRRGTQPGAAATAAAAAALPAPIAQWTFDRDARDTQGRLHGTLSGGTEIAGGRLKLNGRGAFMRTEPLAAELREKTLEAWVSLANLDQQGGGVISIESGDGSTFDAIVFGERLPKRWMAGSSSFERTQDIPGPAEASGPGEWIHVAIVYSVDNSIALYRNGAPYGRYTPSGANSTLRVYPAGESHLLFGLRHTGAGNGYYAGEIDEARLYDRALTEPQIAASANSRGVSIITPEELANAFTKEERDRRDRLSSDRTKLREELKSIPAAKLVYATVSREPEPTFVLERGDIEKKKRQVTAGGLVAVTSLNSDFELPPDAPEARRRERLAAWLASPKNPLTWRVIVNRVWQHHFARGLVGTPNDFGVNGERPSHPELLDWLASEFRAQGGSLKKLHRLIVNSQTYQQASRSEARFPKTDPPPTGNPPAGPKLLQSGEGPKPESRNSQDADNLLLSHYPLHRLEAEAVRDTMLFVSGQLNPQMAGPGFRPFKVTVSNSHFYELIDSANPEFNRRSIYRAGVQSAKDPLLDSLDCPDPSTKTPARGVTTTPLQALSLMNNAFVQRQSARFAERLKNEAGAAAQAQAKMAWRLALGRDAHPDEMHDAIAHINRHGLESLCWALLNSSEFLYVR